MPRTRATAATDSSEDGLAKTSRHVTRLFEMFWNALDVVMLAKELHLMTNEEEATFRDSADESQKRQLVVVDKLIELEPELIPQLSRQSSGSTVIWKYSKKQLSNGQTNGKSEDMRKVREELLGWRTWNPPISISDPKSKRGCNHEEFAYFLCPPTVNWDDLEERTQFVSFGNPPMDPSLWGRFLWPEGKFNKKYPSEGIMMGELLIKAALAILFSPMTARSVSTVVAAGARGHGKRRGPIGVAKTYAMTEVTPAFMAYVACVVRHSLTSDETFSKTGTGFDYGDFYNQLRDFLEQSTFSSRAVTLKAWWNQQLFSGYRMGVPTTSTSLYRKTGTLASLEAEVETYGDDVDPTQRNGSEGAPGNTVSGGHGGNGGNGGNGGSGLIGGHGGNGGNGGNGGSGGVGGIGGDGRLGGVGGAGGAGDPENTA